MKFFLYIILLNVVDTYLLSNFNTLNCNNRNNLIKMDYKFLTDYDNVLNPIPSFQTTIIVNNWIEYTKNQEKEKIPDYINTSLYDFKIFVAIHRDSTNTLYLAWCPNSSDKIISYLVGGLIKNNLLEIHRIIQNPYDKNIVNLKSIDLYNEIYFYLQNSTSIKNITYTELHNYDKRYKLSWNYNILSDP